MRVCSNIYLAGFWGHSSRALKLRPIIKSIFWGVSHVYQGALFLLESLAVI